MTKPDATKLKELFAACETFVRCYRVTSPVTPPDIPLYDALPHGWPMYSDLKRLEEAWTALGLQYTEG